MAIGGATSAGYTLAVADVGATVRVAVTASNGGGSATAVSVQTAVVTAAVAGGSFGQSQVGSLVDSGGAGYLDLSGPYTVSAAVSVSQLNGYIAGSSAASRIRGVIYTNSGGQPGTLVAVTSEVSVAANRAAGWLVLPLASPVQLAAGSYWLGYWYADGNSRLYYLNVAGAERYKAAAYSATGNPPTSFGTSSSASSSYSLTASFVPAGSPPANTSLPVISGSTISGQLLSASTGVWSGSPTGYAYEWRRCNTTGAACTAIGGASGSGYTLVSADVGSTIRVAVTASNSAGSTTAVSAQTAVVTSPQPPTNTSLPVISGSPVAGQVLSASTGVWSGGPTGYAYEWRRCDATGAGCVAIAGASGSSYTLAAADVGSTLRVAVTASNAAGSTTAVSVQTAVVTSPQPPTNTSLPTISGNPVNGQPLSASTGVWTGNPSGYSYEWRRCDTTGAGCVAIAGATGSGYTLVAADVGSTLRVAVTASNAAGSTTAVSAQTAVVTSPQPPTNTSLPTISGSPVNGQLLSASTGVWTGNPSGYSYEWRRCDATGAACTAIFAATSVTYTLTVADLGSTLRVAVTASNAAGSTAAVSTQTAVVSEPAPYAFVRHSIGLGQYAQVTEGNDAGDINGDGYPDVVVGGDNYLVWYRAPDWIPTLIASGSRFGSGGAILVTDINGDGRRDVVTAESSGSNCSGVCQTDWFENTGGSFTKHVLASGIYCHELVLGDFNGDGRNDLACTDTNNSRVCWLEHPADPAQPWPVHTIDNRATEGAAVADLDGNGTPDIVAGQYWYANAGNGASWTPHRYATQQGPVLSAGDFTNFEKISTLDLNGDGRTDIFATLFASSPQGQVWAFLAPQSPATQPWTAVQIDPGPLFAVHSQKAAAFDGTATPQIAIGESDPGGWDFGRNPDTRLLLYRLIGSAASASGWEKTTLDVGVSAHEMAVVDINGDGKPDLVGHAENADLLTPPQNGALHWWQNNLGGVAVPPSNNTAPTIFGTLTSGQTLTSAVDGWTGSTPLPTSYQWQSCDTAGGSCNAIAGATGQSYTVRSGDIGHSIRLSVTASNGAGSAMTVSAAFGAITPPTNTSLPVISGSPVAGQVLSASTGVWSGGPTGYAYEWRRCDATGAGCVAIAGASGSSYTLAAADVGSTLRVAVTASNAAGSTTAVSVQTAVVTSPQPPTNTSLPTISGNPVNGQPLSASTGVWTGNPSGYSYEWRRCDTTGAACTAIFAATGTSYTLTLADLGSTIRVAVTATNPGGSTTAVSTQTAVVTSPQPPANTSLPVISGSAVAGQVLSASTGVWTGNPSGYSYEWRRCDAAGAGCVAIGGATSAGYTLAVADVGATVRVAVTASNGGGSATAVSVQTAVVTAAVAGGSFGQSQVGSLVDSGGAGYLDLSGPYTVSAAVSVSQLNGYIAGSSAASRIRGVIYTNSGGQPGTLVAVTSEVSVAANRAAGWLVLPLASPVQLAAGSYWLGYWYADGNSRLYYLNVAGAERYKAAAYSATGNPPTSFGTSSSASSSYSLTASFVPAGSPPANTSLPVISGSTISGQLLSASTGVWSGSPTGYAYEWRRCNTTGAACTAIGGASGSGYTLVSADVGSTIRVAVTASNSAGSTTAVSAQTAVVTSPQPPTNTSLPVISGSPVAGQVLSASTGVWSGGPTGYAYEWRRCDATGAGCVAIAGASGSSYTLAAADVGSTLRVAVTASNAAGSTTAVSVQTAVVTSPQPPTNTSLPTISGNPVNGQPLSASTGVWTGNPSGYSYEWRRCDTTGAACTAIFAATGTSYTLTLADLGSTIRVAVTATNPGGSTTAVSTQTAVVTSPQPPANTSLPVISGSAVAGQVLSASTGVWTGNPSGYSYEWRRCDAAGAGCVAIGGATSAGYTLAVADVGATVRVAVTASNGGGSATAVSVQTAVVTAAVAGGSFGQSQVGSLVDSGGAGYLDLSGPYTVSAAVSVSQLNGYIAGSSAASRIRGVIYTNSGGQPGTLVAVTSEVSVAANRAAGWLVLPLASPVQLAAGSYWLGYWYADGNSRLYYLNVAGAERYKAAAYSATGNPPTSFGTSSSASSSYSLTATSTAP